MLNSNKNNNFKKFYDVVIIGGGSGGLSFAKNFENKDNKKSLAIFDYVTPTLNDNTWGLGGTCVNVGCIPKKLYHLAGIYKKETKFLNNFGIDITMNNNDINLEILQKNVKNHIRSINFGYKKLLKNKNIDYINKLATFSDKNKIIYGNHQDVYSYLKNNEDKKNIEEIEFGKAIIAVGGKPYKLSEEILPGSKYCITSDDLFFLKKLPKKCLIIGAGYIGLECGSFLKEFGCDVTVLARSTCISSFDKQISGYIHNELTKKDIKIKLHSTPKNIEKYDNDKYIVEYEYENKLIKEDGFDLVIMATKRETNLDALNLNKNFKNLKISKNKKLIGNFDNTIQSKVEENLFAIGDVLEGFNELTPLAIKMGDNLCKYLDNKPYLNFDNKKIPTTIFTDPEYSVIGLKEEEAINLYGKENIISYQGLFEQLEYVVSDMESNTYFKIICQKDTEKILGIHIVGKNTGEIMQGLSIAFNKGLTKKDLEENIGIHPTSAEGIVYLNKIKKDGEKLKIESC